MILQRVMLEEQTAMIALVCEKCCDKPKLDKVIVRRLKNDPDYQNVKVSFMTNEAGHA